MQHRPPVSTPRPAARRLRAAVLAGALGVALGLPAAAAAQVVERDRTHDIPRATSPVVIDGDLEDPAWADALRLELAFEVRPGENVPPPVRTEMLLLYSDTHFLVAFRCNDTDAAQIRARYSDRDSAFSDDWVGVVIDTFNDERRAYEMFVNPLGVQMDMINDDVAGIEDPSWNAIWESGGRITATGYEVEIGIPFSQISFQRAADVQTWGIDGIRNYPRADRHLITLFPRIRGENSYLSQEDKITGFAGVTPGQNLELTPTVTALRTDARPATGGRLANETATGDLGATLRWGLTPNLTLSGTANPDFSQVEADAVQLDINNQFALFFQETRPFFLEGADFFNTQGIDLLHTRTIGDPDAAVKLTGKTGRHTIGMFTARDSGTSVIVPGSEGSRGGAFDIDTQATAGRYRFDVGANSSVGVMATDRRGGDYANSVASFDGRHRFTSADSVSLTVARSSTRYDARMRERLGVGLDRLSGTALRADYRHSERTWNVYGNYGAVDADFRADLGFVTQVDTRRWEAGGGYTWHGDASGWYNRIDLTSNYDQTEEIDGRLLEREYEAFLSYNGPRESFAQVGYGVRDRQFAGAHFDQAFYRLGGNLRPTGTVQFGAFLGWGDGIDFAQARPGDEFDVTANLIVNVGRHLFMRLSHRYNRFDLPAGRLFSAHVPQARVVYQFDTRTQLRVILQYTDVTRDPALYARAVERQRRDLLSQLLFSYKVNAQTVVYVGYTSAFDDDIQQAFSPANRTLFVKTGYAWLR